MSLWANFKWLKFAVEKTYIDSMKVLYLAKLDENDKIVERFTKELLNEGFEFHILNIVNLPSEIPLKMNGEVIDVCTEYNLSKYYEKQKQNQLLIDSYLTDLPVANRKVFIGSPLQIVKWYVKENNIDLVISGGHVTSHTEDIFTSSFANQLMQSLSIPYLSIKDDTDGTKQLHTIAIVREFVDPAKRNLEVINYLSKKTNARVLLVKVNTPNSHMAEVELKQKMDLFAELNDLSNCEYVTIESGDKETAIKDLVSKYNVDLLTLGHIHRNGISSFLRGDLRADVLNHINIPIYMY